MRKMNFAIFGCGVIAGFHAAALGDIENAVLYACADVTRAKADAFAEKHGTRAYADFDALLSDPDIDVVTICTPNGTHAELAIKALTAGKNVVLEKPMAITVHDCEKIIEAAKNAKGKITVISQLRTSPDIQRAREIVRSGALGRIVLADLTMKYYRAPEYYKGSWRGTKKMDGGGALMNQGIHGVDILQYLVGGVKSIASIVRTLSHDIEVEDTAVASLEFESGALGVIVASTATHPGFEREIRINGTRGAIEITENQIVRLVIDGKEEPCTKFEGASGASSNTAISHAEHSKQLASFIRVLNGEACEYVDEFEGKKAVEIIETIYKNTL